MATRSDIEARLRGYAEEYDRQFPPTMQAESRIMARIAITPRDVAPASALRRKGVLARVLVRQLALVCVLLIFVGLLVVGATKLRALPRPNVPIGGVPTRPDVYFSALHFVSGREGWIAETKTALASPLGGPTVLYRTMDGGVSWQSRLTWDGPGPTQVRFSADGTEGLVVGSGGVPLFRTSDGGDNWQRMSLPPEASQVALLYFLDAREGWVIAYLNEATPGFAGVFHTIDGGQHWSQTARLDVNQVFSYGHGGSLQGALMFSDSSTGWFTGTTYSGTGIPVIPLRVYVTRDGGKTWRVQELPTTSSAALNSSNASISTPQFFNPQEGVLLATKFSNPPGPGSAQTGPTVLTGYVFSTSDGGNHWSDPRPVVLPGGTTFLRTLAAVDASHWFVLSDTGLHATSDAGVHWQKLGGWLPSNEHVWMIEFQSPENGWALVAVTGTHPTLAIYHTTDAGAHWSRFSVPEIGA
jgi:photosystem II stability/assembly factor-like uncharacterized protein